MNVTKTFEVRFHNPMIPSELGKFIVEAKNEYAAVCEANMVFFNHRKNLSDLWIKETKEKAWKTADNWGSIFGYKLIDARICGYKIVEEAVMRK
jgi:hypothetical protein